MSRPSCPGIISAKRRTKRKQSRISFKKSCHRLGRVTRNPFLNFLRFYRKSHCGSVIDIATSAAIAWNRMSDKQKAPYRRLACSAPYRKRKYRGRCKTCLRASRRSMSRSYGRKRMIRRRAGGKSTVRRSLSRKFCPSPTPSDTSSRQ